jgi:hypothetical protein
MRLWNRTLIERIEIKRGRLAGLAKADVCVALFCRPSGR